MFLLWHRPDPSLYELKLVLSPHLVGVDSGPASPDYLPKLEFQLENIGFFEEEWQFLLDLGFKCEERAINDSLHNN